MRTHTLRHLIDSVLLRDLLALLKDNRASMALIVAHLGEVEARKLYLSLGHSSMFEYCIRELHFSDDEAYKRIRAARAGRKFPCLLDALAEGKLHFTAVYLLAPHLKASNVDELVIAATHHSKLEIEEEIARRFPKPDRLAVDSVITPLPSARLAPEPVCLSPTEPMGKLAPEPVEGERSLAGSLVRQSLGNGSAPATAARAPRRENPVARPTPLSADRFALQVTIDRSTRDKLQRAQELLSHCLPSGDVAAVIERALDALIEKLEKRKLAATEKPREARQSARRRHIPARVKRGVWKRDQGQCTFVSDTGHRCRERKFLEYDHVEPVALGGQATEEGMRLRCRGHNQYEAERMFGAEFMRNKRELARGKNANRRGEAEMISSSA